MKVTLRVRNESGKCLMLSRASDTNVRLKVSGSEEEIHVNLEELLAAVTALKAFVK